jgi:hypothetical protein
MDHEIRAEGIEHVCRTTVQPDDMPHSLPIPAGGTCEGHVVVSDGSLKLPVSQEGLRHRS